MLEDDLTPLPTWEVERPPECAHARVGAVVATIVGAYPRCTKHSLRLLRKASVSRPTYAKGNAYLNCANTTHNIMRTRQYCQQCNMNHQVLNEPCSRPSLATSMRRAHVPGLIASCVMAKRLSQADLYQQRLPDGMQTDEIAEPRVRLEVIVAGLPCNTSFTSSTS